jgi:hypothetical protein
MRLSLQAGREGQPEPVMPARQPSGSPPLMPSDFVEEPAAGGCQGGHRGPLCSGGVMTGPAQRGPWQASCGQRPSAPPLLGGPPRLHAPQSRRWRLQACSCLVPRRWLASLPVYNCCFLNLGVALVPQWLPAHPVQPVGSPQADSVVLPAGSCCIRIPASPLYCPYGAPARCSDGCGRRAAEAPNKRHSAPSWPVRAVCRSHHLPVAASCAAAQPSKNESEWSNKASVAPNMLLEHVGH